MRGTSARLLALGSLWIFVAGCDRTGCYLSPAALGTQQEGHFKAVRFGKTCGARPVVEGLTMDVTGEKPVFATRIEEDGFCTWAISRVVDGRARPIMRLTIVSNRPGNPIARNRKPKRAASAVSTSRGIRGSEGEITAARQRRTTPNGMRNQPDRPKSVMFSNTLLIHCGKWLAHSLAAASSRNIEAKTR